MGDLEGVWQWSGTDPPELGEATFKITDFAILALNLDQMEILKVIPNLNLVRSILAFAQKIT
jgi:hypothetical protein